MQQVIQQSTLINDLQLRIQKIQTRLAELSAEACLLSTTVNLLYVAGRVINGFCYIPAEGNARFFIAWHTDAAASI